MGPVPIGLAFRRTTPTRVPWRLPWLANMGYSLSRMSMVTLALTREEAALVAEALANEIERVREESYRVPRALKDVLALVKAASNV